MTFSAGDAHRPPPASLTILVGPNSGGKTTALRQIAKALTGPPGSAREVVGGVDPRIDADENQFAKWVDAGFVKQPSAGGGTLWCLTGKETRDALRDRWKSNSPWPHIPGFICSAAWAEDRLAATEARQLNDPFSQSPVSYLDHLQGRPELIAELWREATEAFGVAVAPDWGPKEARLRVVERPSEIERSIQNEPPLAFASLKDLPGLETYGHGLRSYVGTWLATKWGRTAILLVDEPELYLHPPQSRRLGALLAREAKDEERQVFVATHSADFILGALSVAQANVSVWRITRQGKANTVAELDSQALRSFLANPLLRSVAGTNGLFHEGVVLCEDNSDCCFYESVLRRCVARGEIEGTHDYFFTHGRGKGSLADLAEAYRKFGVPVAAIADLDLLRREGEFQKTFRACGGGWKYVENDYRAANEALGALPPVVSAAKVREAVCELPEASANGKPVAIDGASKRRIERLLKDASSWSKAKAEGVDAVEDADGKAACMRLLETCKQRGLFIVSRGELESWAAKPAGEDKRWLVWALGALADEQDDDWKGAERFMMEVTKHLSTPPS